MPSVPYDTYGIDCALCASLAVGSQFILEAAVEVFQTFRTGGLVRKSKNADSLADSQFVFFSSLNVATSQNPI
jgi:hypothetical protein